MHWDIGGYTPRDIDVVAAFDIDRRKVGKDVSEAIFEKPNCTTVFCGDVAPTGTKVRMGRVLDGCSEHMGGYPDECTFLVSDERQPEKKDVVAVLRESRGRDPRELPAGGFRGGGPLLCRMRPGGGSAPSSTTYPYSSRATRCGWPVSRRKGFP